MDPEAVQAMVEGDEQCEAMMEEARQLLERLLDCAPSRRPPQDEVKKQKRADKGEPTRKVRLQIVCVGPLSVQS